MEVIFMKVIQQKAEFLWATPNIGEKIEAATRTCYKSEGGIKDGSAERLFDQVVKQSHHDSVTEHGVISMRLTTDRATMAQITRHRLFSFSIESQRYCNYTKDKFDNEITVIEPRGITKGSLAYAMWLNAMESAEQYYFKLIEEGLKPEVARSVLPNSCKTEIVITGNLRQWRSFLKLRLTSHAQSDIRYLCTEIVRELLDNDIPMYLISDVIGLKPEFKSTSNTLSVGGSSARKAADSMTALAHALELNRGGEKA